MEIQRNQEFKVERLAKDEAIQEVLGLANASGCMYSFHFLCFLSLLQLPCFMEDVTVEARSVVAREGHAQNHWTKWH